MTQQIFVVTVLDTTATNHTAFVWGVFASEESAVAKVKAMADEDGCDFGREEPVFLLQGDGLTWHGVQPSPSAGILKYSGIVVAIHCREVRP